MHNIYTDCHLYALHIQRTPTKLLCRAKPKAITAYFSSKQLLSFGLAEKTFNSGFTGVGSQLYVKKIFQSSTGVFVDTTPFCV